MNEINKWSEGSPSELSALEVLDLTGNGNFVPPEHVLKIRMLKEIRGVSWNTQCVDCTLKKSPASMNVSRLSRGEFTVYPEKRCRGITYRVSKILKNFAQHSFLADCRDQRMCFSSEVEVIPAHQCWESANEALMVEYVLAPLGLILNLTILLVVTATTSLRKNASMLFITSLALGDFLVGLYSLCVTIARHALSYPNYVLIIKQLCPCLGFLWVSGQFMTIATSVLLTLERYVVIIFPMRPDLNFTPQICLSCIVASWVTAVSYASLPFFGIGTYVSTTFCVPITPSKGAPHSFSYSVSIAAVGFLLYIVTIPMYLHIFASVRKSGHQMGVQRNGKLAKRIALLVVTNMVFFMIPVVIALLWLLSRFFQEMSVITREVIVGSLPTIFFSINSCLNPLLYAFRNGRFQMALKHRYYKLVNRNVVFVEQLAARMRSDTKTCQGTAPSMISPKYPDLNSPNRP